MPNITGVTVQNIFEILNSKKEHETKLPFLAPSLYIKINELFIYGATQT